VRCSCHYKLYTTSWHALSVECLHQSPSPDTRRFLDRAQLEHQTYNWLVESKTGSQHSSPVAKILSSINPAGMAWPSELITQIESGIWGSLWIFSISIPTFGQKYLHFSVSRKQLANECLTFSSPSSADRNDSSKPCIHLRYTWHFSQCLLHHQSKTREVSRYLY
jgi:hypothetical protein